MTLPSAPPAQFNFAQFLIALNNSRKDKTALIDDVGSLTYGEMGDDWQLAVGEGLPSRPFVASALPSALRAALQEVAAGAGVVPALAAFRESVL